MSRISDIRDRLAKATDAAHIACPWVFDDLTYALDRIERLEAALKPFSESANVWSVTADDRTQLSTTDIRESHDFAEFTIGDLRRARSALHQTEGGIDGKE